MDSNQVKFNLQTKCDICKTNCSEPFNHCDRCDKNMCKHCHPESFASANNKNFCKYCFAIRNLIGHR